MAQNRQAMQKHNNISRWGLLIGILVIAANLRAPLTSVGSLLSAIREDLQISSTLAGSLTTLPLLAFFAVSPFASTIANRVGMEWTLFYSFILLTIGLIVRPLSGITLLISGTIIVGVAIAFGNVLLPGLIKMKFPMKIGLLTGLYAVFMNIFGALASGLSLPVSRISGFGWQGSLASWAILSIVALMVWFPQLKKKADSLKSTDSKQAANNKLWKSSLAWNITVYMGTQSMIFFTMISWLPDILTNSGYSSNMAGWMLSLMQLAFIPFTFITPLIAERMADQRLLTAITGILVLIGSGGLMTGSAVMITIAVICIGGACGAAFSLSMMFFSLRSNDGHEASRVSGMAQSLGYLIAAAGPILLGFIYDITANWTLPIAIVGMVGFILIVTGVKSGADRKIVSTE
nr:MFS transporter [Lentibacillus jeotgali]